MVFFIESVATIGVLSASVYLLSVSRGSTRHVPHIRLLDLTIDQDADSGFHDRLQLRVLLVAVDLEYTDIVLAVGTANEFGVHVDGYWRGRARDKAMRGS